MSLIIALGIWIYRSPLSTIYKVKYIHGADEIIIQTYRKGDVINFPEAPIKSGYNFIGWSLDQDFDEVLTQQIVVNQELTLYAQWQEKSYTLNYNGQDINITVNHQFVTSDDKLIITYNDKQTIINNPSLVGKEFVKWQIYDGNDYFDIDQLTIAEVSSTKLSLVPLFNESMISFEICGNNDYYEIQNLSHTQNITYSHTLKFDIILNENVSKSNVNITTSSGIASLNRNGTLINVKITDFSENFVININNITINEYNIDIDNNGETISYRQHHGEIINLPKLTLPGYKLLGFKDSQGRLYLDDYIVTGNLSLSAIWEEEVYTISFPKSNGMYLISLNKERLASNKVITKKYNDSIEFSITLSTAYNNSNYVVYASTQDGDVLPTSQEGNVFTFANISSDMQIVIDNVTLNTYSVSIDGTHYGDFGYGSWIFVDGENISIKDVTTNITTSAKTLIDDTNFGGWICNNSIVINCIVQDIADSQGNITINGNYSKKIAKINLIANGGVIETTEVLIVEGEDFDLPTPTKYGYTFVGWYTKLVEVNTIVDQDLSILFTEITDFQITLYAGWTK